MRSSLLLFLLILTFRPGLAQPPPDSTPTGFYHTRQVDKHWELVDPQGKPFLSNGVDAVRHHQDDLFGTSLCPYQDAIVAKYGSIEGWQKGIAQNLLHWGFNTLGARSDDEIARIDVNGAHLAYTPVVDFGASFVQSKLQGQPVAYSWMKGVFADVFDPDFATAAQALALARCAPLKDDPNLLGWFTDNEMRWGPDWRGRDELLVVFLNSPLHTPGRDAALALLQQRYPDIAKFNQVWTTSFASWDEAKLTPNFSTPAGVSRHAVYVQNGEVNRTASDDLARAFVSDCDAFLALLADRYFKITTEAIKAVDPHHLVIGCRFAYVPAPPVIAAAGKYVDVISFNCYDFTPTKALTAYAVTHKPLLIGEFGFRAQDSGLPNTRGAGPLVATQEDRTRCYEAYLQAARQSPNFVGSQWFKLGDEPKEGRFDGENSNYGIVDIHDQPYDLLVKKMTEINTLPAYR